MSTLSLTRKITSIILSLSLLADQLFRKAPRTTSLSVNKTTRQALTRLCHTITDANTAIISNSWMTVLCPVDIVSESVFLSIFGLKKDNCCPDMLTIKPPGPLYFLASKRNHIDVEDLSLQGVNLPREPLREQAPDFRAEGTSLFGWSLPGPNGMMWMNLEQPSKLSSENLWRRKLKSAPEFLSVGPWQNSGL